MDAYIYLIPTLIKRKNKNGINLYLNLNLKPWLISDSSQARRNSSQLTLTRPTSTGFKQHTPPEIQKQKRVLHGSIEKTK